MVNVFEMAEVLIGQVKRSYGSDIALIAYYGSYALGKATPRSDLDFFFIPAEPDGATASLQFVLDGIGFDFWPISWERAERMSLFREPMATIIADCSILYVRSEEDLERFNGLRRNIAEMALPHNRKALLERAVEEFKDCFVHLYGINRPDIASLLTAVRMEACRIVTKVLYCLSLLNQTYFRRGWGQNTDEIEGLPLKPEGLNRLLRTILEERNPETIRVACDRLVENMRRLLVTEQAALAEPAPDYRRAQGFYEEAKGTLNKLVTACEQGDYTAAFFASISIQYEIRQLLGLAEEGMWHTELSSWEAANRSYNGHGLPNLISLLEPERLGDLREAAERLDQGLRELLDGQGVGIHLFHGLEEFRTFVIRHYGECASKRT